MVSSEDPKVVKFLLCLFLTKCEVTPKCQVFLNAHNAREVSNLL